MMRKVTIYWHDDHSPDTVIEEYIEGETGSFRVGHVDPEGWASDLLAHFNATLRPGESPRTVERIEVVPFDGVPKLAHDWHKTNAITVIGRDGSTYDTARCEVCGITAKRYGVGPHVRDRKFKADAFITCNGAQAALAKRNKQ